MTLEERQVIYKQLENQKGQEHQILVAIEEMSELTKELTKFLREDSYTNTKKLCEEMADAKVVLEQLDRFFDPEQKLVPFIMDYKLERLKMFYLDMPLTESERKTAFEEGLDNTIENGSFIQLIFGTLTKYKTTSFYDWEIGIKRDGKHSILRFQNEKELIQQDVFLKLCMRELHFLPIRIDASQWVELVNKALTNLLISND
jgi:hypothetical protein